MYERTMDSIETAARDCDLEALRLALDQIPEVSLPTYQAYLGRILHLTFSRDPRALDCFELLLKKGASVLQTITLNGNTPLHHACSYPFFRNHIEILTGKVANLEMRNVDEETPLHLACKQPVIFGAELLLAKGVNYEGLAKDGRPLHYACLCEEFSTASKAIIQLLCAKGANLESRNHNNQTALHVACYYNQAHCAEALLDGGANKEAVTDHGYTPLMIASKHIRIDCVKVLISNGVDVNARNEIGRTALHYASSVLRGDRVVETLIRNGADVNAKDNKGMTPLMYSCTIPVEDPTELLLQAGASVSETDRKGNTALHLVSVCSGGKDEDIVGTKLSIIEVLFRYGANRRVKNNSGETPRDVARDQRVYERVFY